MSVELESEPTERTGWRALRTRLAERPTLNLAYRVGVAVVGIAVLVVGILAIPYPGPGWAIVFAGLGILATEFAWARRALGWLRDKYRQGMAWYSARGPVMRVFAAVATLALVIATLWALGTFGLVGGWIGVEWQWLRSPLTW
ncbi:TIGR02611 family protein [Nocardia sp. CA-107356]|uniref:TIGR02611 family protein n=1 Tax=Nocardia sp. CA-107356 TaxID=3239972 RepID=UPI003D8D84F4